MFPLGFPSHYIPMHYLSVCYYIKKKTYTILGPFFRKPLTQQPSEPSEPSEAVPGSWCRCHRTLVASSKPSLDQNHQRTMDSKHTLDIILSHRACGGHKHEMIESIYVSWDIFIHFLAALIDWFIHSFIYLLIHLFVLVYLQLVTYTIHREKEREYRVINIHSPNGWMTQDAGNVATLALSGVWFASFRTFPLLGGIQTHINTYHMLESKQLHGFIHHFASGEDPNPRAPPRARCSSRPQEAFQVWINGPCRRSVVKTENCDWD